MKTQLPILAGLLLLGVVTYVQGRWSERWVEHEGLDEMAGRITNVPMDVGEWTGETAEEHRASTLQQKQQDQVAGALSSLTRTYRDARNGPISLFLLYGRPAQIWIHTPDRCYPAAGFESISAPTTERIETSVGVAEFGVSSFRKSDKSDNKSGAQTLRIYWGYSADGHWLAPDNLKWAFGGHWGVYKIYVIVPVANPGDMSAEESRVRNFVRDMLPEVNHTLFPSTAEQTASNLAPSDNADSGATEANPPAAKAAVGAGSASEK